MDENNFDALLKLLDQIRRNFTATWNDITALSRRLNEITNKLEFNIEETKLLYDSIAKLKKIIEPKLITFNLKTLQELLGSGFDLTFHQRLERLAGISNNLNELNNDPPLRTFILNNMESIKDFNENTFTH